MRQRFDTRFLGRFFCPFFREGLNAEIEIFEGLSHGFGLGEGTVAEDWIDNAINFWNKNSGGI